MRRVAGLLCVMLALCVQGQSSSVSIKYGPYLQNMGCDEVTITWVTDNASIGWVEPANDGSDSFYSEEHRRYYDSKDGIKQISTVHSVTLRGLLPNTTYRYRVYAQAVISHEGNSVVYGDYAATNVYSQEPLRFTTNSCEKENITFAVLNDIHGDNERMKRLVAACGIDKTDFVIFNGDMSSMFNTEEQVFCDFVNTAVELFASEQPFYYARGNHETRGTFAHRFHGYFSTGADKLYYAFRHGPVLFVVLDSGEDKPDSDIEYYGLVDYDNYRSEQAQWLRRVIASDEYKSAPIKIVVSHIPPSGDWHGSNEVRRKFVEVLRDAAPDLMLCGHEHELIYTSATEAVPFPVLVNSNNTVVRVDADATTIALDVVDESGRVVKSLSFEK